MSDMITSSSAEKLPEPAEDEPRLFLVPQSGLDEIWVRFGVGEMFRAHEEKSGGHWTADWLFSSIKAGEQDLWVIVRGNEEIVAALVTDITPYRNGLRTCMVTIIVGSEPRSWIGLRTELEDWARNRGCDKIEMIGRIGWKRIIPDWKPTAIFFEKALT